MKNIIGICGQKGVGKTTVASYLQEKGYYLVDMDLKVKEVSKHLLGEDRSENDLLLVRERGYRINHCYWLNMVLISIDAEVDKIVLDNIWPFEGKGIIKTLQIVRPELTNEIIDGIEEIDNDGSIEELYEKIDNSIYSTKK